MTDIEWLETDGRGGYAMSTAALMPTRRYHGLLVHARKPPVDRVVLVNAIEVLLERQQTISTPEIVEFLHDAVPTWSLRFPDGSLVHQEFRLCRKPRMAVLHFTFDGETAGARLRIRPFITGREFHSLHFRNPNFNFDPEISDSMVRWTPYHGIPTITAVHSGAYLHEPVWRAAVFYPQERARGFDAYEDHASPGYFVFDPTRPATLAFSALNPEPLTALETVHDAVKHSNRRRKRLQEPIARAADAYFVRRGKKGRSIIAGYPWFNDWGRDTMIAARGFAYLPGKRRHVREVLFTWMDALDEGMLPNCFTDEDTPQYHAVDAPLWFIIAAYEFLISESGKFPAKVPGKKRLLAAIASILHHYASGTRHGIQADDDGLLRAGSSDTSLTWMDARVDGRPITPRNGKPVEVNALWINALWIGSQFDESVVPLLQTAITSFDHRFWLDDGYLADVIDDESGVVDRTFRPNQIFVVGGLPLVLLPREKAMQVVESTQRYLHTPIGLRTLSTEDPRYRGRYEGSPSQRDSIYHQGAVWPWLLGPFIEAWLRVRGVSGAAVQEAQEKFMQPWLANLAVDGLGHICELADGDSPHTPRGCPFQAWSLSELIRTRALLDNPARPNARGIWIGENVD